MSERLLAVTDETPSSRVCAPSGPRVGDRAELYQRLPLLETDRWWTALARSSPDGRVLELGAGTGRLTRAFRDAGATVTAVERDPGMLSSLRAGLGADPDVEVVDADVTALPDGRRVGLVALPASLLNELPDHGAREAVLAGAGRRCRADGRVAIHLLAPWWLVRLTGRSAGRLQPADGSPGVDVTLEAGAFDVWAARRRATLTYRFADGTVLRDQLDAAVVTPSELVGCLSAAGLEPIRGGDDAPSSEPAIDAASWHVLARPHGEPSTSAPIARK